MSSWYVDSQVHLYSSIDSQIRNYGESRREFDSRAIMRKPLNGDIFGELYISKHSMSFYPIYNTLPFACLKYGNRHRGGFHARWLRFGPSAQRSRVPSMRNDLRKTLPGQISLCFRVLLPDSWIQIDKWEMSLDKGVCQAVAKSMLELMKTNEDINGQSPGA